MRKELSVIGAFSTVISFVASVVLCMQVAQAKPLSNWHPTNLLTWSIEIVVFGLAILVWRRRASLGGWAVGIAALVLVRLALSAACARAAAQLHPSMTFHQALGQVSACEPRIAAVLFSLMVFYPLRVLLPARLFGRRKAAERTSRIESQGDASLWIVRGEERLQVQLAGQNGKKEVALQSPAGVVTIASPNQIAGTIELPLRTLLPRIPQDYVAPRATQYSPSHPVSIPLSLIVPQLKEGQIFVRLEEMRDLLPPGLLVAPESTGLEGDPLLVSLALEDVVPALPLEVLELPPPSPPAWAELPDPETVVFATV